MDELACYIGKQKHRYNILYNFRRRGEPHHTGHNNQLRLEYAEGWLLCGSRPTLIFRDLQASQP